MVTNVGHFVIVLNGMKKKIPVPECWKIYGLFWKVTCSSITGVAPLNQSYIIIYMPR